MKKILLGLLILVPVAAAIAWVGWFSPWLSVETFEVQISQAPEIAGPLTAEEVIAAAGVPIGTPLLRVSLGDVTDRVEALPSVARAEVSRSWPTALSISVTRREPVAQVAGSAGGYDVVDADGAVIRTIPAPESGVPIVDATGAGAQAAITVARELPDWLRDKVATISAGTRNDVQLNLRNGSTVYWGSVSDPELKADVLKALLQVKAAYYDVSAPGTPATSDLPVRPTLQPSDLQPSPSSSG